MVYDPSTSVETIFNKIQDFQDICELIGKDKTDYQLVDTAYLIFRKLGLFRDSLLRWNKQIRTGQDLPELETVHSIQILGVYRRWVVCLYQI